MKRTILLVLALVLLLTMFTACDLFGGAERVDWEDGVITVSSDELKPAETLPEGEHYKASLFDERPLVQRFKFEVHGDWSFTITVTGEVGTKFEVYTLTELSGGPAEGYGYDQGFTLNAETESFSRQRLLAEGQEPPVDVEIKVMFATPIEWEMVIEE